MLIFAMIRAARYNSPIE